MTKLIVVCTINFTEYNYDMILLLANFLDKLDQPCMVHSNAIMLIVSIIIKNRKLLIF